MPAQYEVRITPLILGSPGGLETDGSMNHIEEADTTVAPVFLDDGFEVNIAINDVVTASVTIPIDEAVVADLEPFEFAVRIAYKRPAATDFEALLYGPANVITDYAAGTVTLVVQDPSIRCQHHYLRRGDALLNLSDDKGEVAAWYSSIDTIIDAARNTQEQQDRNVPALAFTTWYYGEDAVTEPPLVTFERGQEVWDLVQQVYRSVTGPDAYSAPVDAWTFPLYRYAEIGLYDPPTNPASPATGELGRNLDPADPDAPAAGEVIFEYGRGIDNLIGLVETPDRPTTHAHVLSEDAKYRRSAASVDGSARAGVWVDWIATSFTISGGDTDPLRAVADARIKSHAFAPKHFTCTLRPDDAQPYHYGHPFFTGDTVGDFAIGDYVRVRAARGQRSFSTLARVTAVKFGMQDGLPVLDVQMVPAVPGSPDDDPQGD
jgi:hypothetical protein